MKQDPHWLIKALGEIAKEKGVSETDLSLTATGNREAMRSLRTGRLAWLRNIEAMAEAMGYEIELIQCGTSRIGRRARELKRIAEVRGKATSIMKAIEEDTGIKRRVILSAVQKKPICLARQTAIYATREATNASYPIIAKVFQRGDHSTIIHAYKRAQERACADPEYASQLRRYIEVAA